MIDLEDRQTLAQEIKEACQADARLSEISTIVGLSARTLQRRQACGGLVSGDHRLMVVRPMPSHVLTGDERAAVLAAANEPRFADSLLPLRGSLARRGRAVVHTLQAVASERSHSAFKTQIAAPSLTANLSTFSARLMPYLINSQQEGARC